MSKGGDYFSAAEAKYEWSEAVAEYAPGDDHLSTDFWYIGGVAEIRGNSSFGSEARLNFQFTSDELGGWHNVELTDPVLSGYGWATRAFGVTSPFIRNNLVPPHTNLKIRIVYVLHDDVNDPVVADRTNVRNVSLYMYSVAK